MSEAPEGKAVWPGWDETDTREAKAFSKWYEGRDDREVYRDHDELVMDLNGNAPQ